MYWGVSDCTLLVQMNTTPVPFEKNILSPTSRLLCIYPHEMVNQLSVWQNLASPRRQNSVCACDGLTPENFWLIGKPTLHVDGTIQPQTESEEKYMTWDSRETPVPLLLHENMPRRLSVRKCHLFRHQVYESLCLGLPASWNMRNKYAVHKLTRLRKLLKTAWMD